MAHVMIPFANGKGGVGKTALACSYAAAQAHLGVDVVLADINETQHTALAWSEVRNHNAILPKVRVEALNARQALEMVGRHDVLIVDTPGSMDKSTLSLAKRCTFMVIPTGPNPTYELRPTVELLHGLRAEGIELWRLGVVLSRFSMEKEPQREEEKLAREYLALAGYEALEGCVRNAPAYGSALAEGYGLSEIGSAAQLRNEADRMMAAIMQGVARAQRRLQRGLGPSRDRDRERGGRE
ncbi:MAG: ParA family protein [Proteobacteria bacterium]|nr:ParA family protein [Pseudomonadota bacterium]